MIIYIILIMVFKVFNIEEVKNRIRKSKGGERK